MLVSIIIVNYNVKYFLEQCLNSVLSATATIEAEVFVVDNNSIDGSLPYLEPKFPTVHFIANKHNYGFAKANNIALQYCNGKYILYLNPDTIIGENCIEHCVQFFKTNANCGGVGIRMIDGSGNFLPESKRAFPSPRASFFKLTGLANIFPHSKLFNQYALGHLDEYKNHEVDVLAGAFLMSPRHIIEACKGFDEIFFMYGEDIDLSYRIQKAGYKNYYLSSTSIIHFKGESLKKGTSNHVKMFYGAMGKFVLKHFGKSKGALFANGIRLAIFLRAIVAFLKRGFKKLGLQMLDAVTIVASLFVLEKWWIHFERDGQPFTQPSEPYFIVGFAFIYLIAAALSGMYDKLYKPTKAIWASFIGIVVMIAAYSLLPESQRFSRGVIIIGGLLAGVLVTASRWGFVTLGFIEKQNDDSTIKQTVIVGSTQEFKSATEIFKKAGLQERIVGRVALGKDANAAIGNLHQLHLLIVSMQIEEVVFCQGTLTYYQIIQTIQTLPRHISYRFIGKNTSSIVGSDSNATTGETFTAEGFYQINQSYHKRMKYLVDVCTSLIILLGFPVHLVLLKNSKQAFKDAFSVLLNNKSWVGYCTNHWHLPKIKIGVLSCYGLRTQTAHPLNHDALQKLDTLYAKNYEFWQDVHLLLRNYKNLGG
ncbi:MAG: glycosyltransferase [Flavobacterium sp.]|nr:glycosyltransferase [Flavobacterium sp.]